MSPKDFTYNLPDGYEFKPEHRAKVDSWMEKAGVTDNQVAQELIDIHVEIVEDFANELATLYGKEASLATNYETEGN